MQQNLLVRRPLLATFSITIFAIAGVAFAQQSLAPRQSATAPKHLALAESLVANLDISNTNYEHGAGTVKFTAPCESHTDCSGFIDALLKQTYGFDKDQFKKWLGANRPTAHQYHDAIEGEKGFQHIEHIQDARPGDILAVKYLKRTDNTGHVMLVDRLPQKIQPLAPVVPGTQQWEVAVIDSSESGHGDTDTRYKKGANGKDHDGLGEGILRLYTDSAGSIAGFAWSPLKASKFKEPADEHLVIGRLRPDSVPK
jgi:hypothetical protein